MAQDIYAKEKCTTVGKEPERDQTSYGDLPVPSTTVV